MGAKGVSTLAARMLLTLVPANMPMFRMQLNDGLLQDAHESEQNMQMTEEQEAWETEVQTALSKYERAVQADIEASGDRPTMHEALLHLITCGNGLLNDSPKVGEGMRFFPLSRYVVSRDPMGQWVEIVIHEKAALSAMDEETQRQILAALHSEGESNPEQYQNSETYLDIYTHALRKGDKCEWYQECAGAVIKGTEGSSPIDGCPFIPLRMYWVAGEDYGRSYVENHLGDLKSLEALTQAIVEGSAAAAKVVFLVNPNGTTNATKLAAAPNCGFVPGNASEVTALQVQKTADMRVAMETVQILTNRLAEAFMLMEGIRRDAERVTAEEIRAMAAELEAAQGGIYSMMSQEFQTPYIKRRIHRLTKSGKVPKLPGASVQPAIITGFEALGRGNDKNKLVSFVSTLAQALGPQAIQQYLNVPDFISRLAASDGINTKGLIKDAAQLANEQAQAEQQQAVESLGPEAIKALGGQMGNAQMPAPESAQPIM